MCIKLVTTESIRVHLSYDCCDVCVKLVTTESIHVHLSVPGSLLNLAKHPSSTVQILGAEKALFRALKTKHDTPKYGLIYHASLVGGAQPKHKGKVCHLGGGGGDDTFVYVYEEIPKGDGNSSRRTRHRG